MKNSGLLLPIAVACLAAPPQLPTQTSPAGGATEELIAEKDPQSAAADDEDIVHMATKKVAWRSRVGERWTAVVNGVALGRPVDEVRAIDFTLDGAHVVYQARTNKQWTLMLDGQPASPPADDLRGPVVNRVTGESTYAIKRGKTWRLVRGAEEAGPLHDDVRLPIYSDDGTRTVFRAKRKDKWSVVIDGVADTLEFDAILTHQFSRDGSRVAYVARRGDDYFVVVDGKQGPPFDIVGGAQFSADGRRFAYAGAHVHRKFGSQHASGRVIVDGVAGPEFEGTPVGSLLKAALIGVDRLVVGQVHDLRSDVHGVSSPAFSPDATRVAYAARTGRDTSTIFVDGAAGAVSPSIVAGPLFARDGQIAWMTSEGGSRTAVMNGEAIARIAQQGTDFIDAFLVTPNGDHLVSVSVNGGTMFERGQTSRARRRVYVDGVAHPEYDAHFLGALSFSPDGVHMAYVVGRAAVAGGDRSFVVLDGVAGPGYDLIFGPVRFEADGRTIHYTARTGRRFYSVRQPVLSDLTW